jgi:hypothetical protein
MEYCNKWLRFNPILSAAQVPEDLDIDMNDPELHLAASKIQATFRGHKIRKSVDDADKNWGNWGFFSILKSIILETFFFGIF